MRTIIFILTVSIAIVACDSKSDNSTQTNSVDSFSKATQDFTVETVFVQPAIVDSTHFSGRLTKVVYPSNRVPCKDSLSNFSVPCLGEIPVPCNYLRIDYFQYTEGQILTIHYPDSSTISILCGSNANINIPENKTKNLHHKKVIIKGYQITYENVPEQRLRLFNYAFELLNKVIKK